ncbi:cyclopropane-fatty-acyl-phospholipid synthase family protein [Sphingomonas sp.]|uniref:cyclopropane-fatty-acyl-phospholipid synthase family protein n=1 Tax=Sphingomonas sp. TaxID=28214 RepID=UPI00286AD6BA|nr:cyclopropane-fatty-acyl-phospholipid synthase family protein [Sphingomonas sp.]
MASRGQHLFSADRRFATGGGLLGLAAPAFDRVLDQLHEGLRTGGFHAILPDGARREIGFHAPGPVATVTLHSWMSLVRLATSGSVGWYKAWEHGEWSSLDLVALFELFAANAVTLGDAARAKGAARWVNALVHRLRDNAPGQARDNIAAHYDLGNDFYAAWLDEGMTYSSAHFLRSPMEGVGSHEAIEPAMLLEQAQSYKISLLLDRLSLAPGSRLLEIGCGWGSLAIAAARRGAIVTGLTLSTEQKAWAEARVAEAGLTDRITIRLQDYRAVTGEYDAIASAEMVEAVGQRWWPVYLDTIARALRPGGRAALQYISIDHRLFARYSASADFIQAYIFPGGMLVDEPSFEALARGRGLSWDGRDGFGAHYAETLRLWRARYDAAVQRGALAGFDDRFHRLWRYYLMYCEGGFKGRCIDVAQVTMVKG